MKKLFICFLVLFSINFVSCNKFEYNIYETDRVEKPVEVTTAYNLNRILNMPQKDTLRIAVFGDTQRFYNETEELVDIINEIPNLDFIIITGDLSDFGVALEFDLLNKLYMKFKVPFLTVIGNHDYLGNGKELYQEVYGPLNYSFTWSGIRFIGHDTNSRDAGFPGNVPDLNWLQQQVKDTANYKGCIFYSHVPPFVDDFDKSLEIEYIFLLNAAKNTIINLQGHLHSYALEERYTDDRWFLFPGNPKNRVYSLVTIYPNAQPGHMFDCIPVHF